jgi:hypothetical protein
VVSLSLSSQAEHTRGFSQFAKLPGVVCSVTYFVNLLKLRLLVKGNKTAPNAKDLFRMESNQDSHGEHQQHFKPLSPHGTHQRWNQLNQEASQVKDNQAGEAGV